MRSIFHVLLLLIIFDSGSLIAQTKKTSSKNINNAPNYGNQHIGDTYILMSSQVYVELSSKNKKRLLDSLRVLLKYPNTPYILINIESGNQERHKLAEEFSSFINNENTNGGYENKSVYSGRFPDHPVTIMCPRQHYNFTKHLIHVLRPFITEKTGYYIDTFGGSSQNKIEFYINGTPTFNKYGQVIIH